MILGLFPTAVAGAFSGGFGLAGRLPGEAVWFDNPVISELLWPATAQTLGMTLITAVFTVLVGLPLGLVLVSTSSVGLTPMRGLYQTLSLVVNIGRSFPFIILMITLIPFTRLVVGTSLGWYAATVPLTVAAIPFFARLVESNIMGVDPGKVEAAQMMGASRMQIMLGVQVREALAPLIQSVTVLLVTLIGYSAVAGAVGGGGLGDLAITYGYVQWQTDVMVITVVLLVVIVEVFQVVGDMLSRLVDHR